MSYSDFFTLYSSHFTVLPGGTIQLATTAGNTSQGLGDGGGQTLPTLTMTNTPGGGAIVQYAQGQDGQFFVPGWFRKHTKHTPPITVQFSYPILGFCCPSSYLIDTINRLCLNRLDVNPPSQYLVFIFFFFQFVLLEICKRTLCVQSRQQPDSTRLVLS